MGSKVIAYDVADRAAQKVYDSLGTPAPDWVLGVGVGVKGKDHYVTVTVSDTAKAASIPAEIDKVPVKVTKREMAKAL